MNSMQLTFKQIDKIWPKILVCATDGKKYPLSTYYSIHLEIKDHPLSIYLDTGGEMVNCDFFQARIVGNELHRLCDDDVWRKVATLEYPNID